MKGMLQKQKPIQGKNKAQGEVSNDRKLLKGYLHKTSNSLCGIKGYASLISAPGTSAEHAIQWARKIVGEVERMEAIYHSVGDLAAVPMNAAGNINTRDVLDTVTRECELEFPHLQVYHRNLPEMDVLMPAADLAQIIHEIVKNSAESCTPEQSDIRVAINWSIQPTGFLTLTISDNGPGISPELLTQISDPFLTTKDDHLGIGLTRVETIMDMHDLNWIVTNNPGHGVTVTLEIGTPKDGTKDHSWTKGLK
jgi:nitrogen-specific signal transduction histidine kinase